MKLLIYGSWLLERGNEMEFTYIGGTDLEKTDVYRHVWQRVRGNLVIVVIDDELVYADPEIEDITGLRDDQAFLPMLRDRTRELLDTKAIGFFPLAADRDGTKKVLNHIKGWIDEISTYDTRVCFLVDAVHGEGGGANTTAARYIKEVLPDNYHMRYVTRGGVGGEISLSDEDFSKAVEYLYFNENDEACSPKLMSFLGIGLHKDEIINDAIQFYAKAWKTSWQPKGWVHDYLEGRNRHSLHLQALADWLGDSVSIDDLVSNNTDQTESAKSLMIWHEADLWEEENPPWRARDRRSIKGKVLNAVLKKLGIPLSKTNPILDEGLITMPCVPCFPFLVSLRGFLWRCEEEEEEISVSELCFFQLGEKPQVNVFRLVLPLRNPVMLAKKFFGIGEKRAGAFTNSLRDLTCCRTDGLMGHGDYMPLFTNGTESPVVAVEIAPGQINLIWSVR